MILDTIVDHKRQEVARLRKTGVRPPAEPPAPRRAFIDALLREPGVSIIAEAKKASPSKGRIAADFDVRAIAADYTRGGAAAMSVLTDERFFEGGLPYLAEARQACPLPVLRKDFLIDVLQVEEAAAWGADAVLLIAAILDRHALADLHQAATELGMDVLVEVHDLPELERAMAAGARLIGVNNRDLRTFTVDLETTFRVRRALPEEIPLVSESGLSGPDDMVRLRDHGVSAALVGEYLMRAAEPAKALAELREAGR